MGHASCIVITGKKVILPNLSMTFLDLFGLSMTGCHQTVICVIKHQTDVNHNVASHSFQKKSLFLAKKFF